MYIFSPRRWRLSHKLIALLLFVVMLAVGGLVFSVRYTLDMTSRAVDGHVRQVVNANTEDMLHRLTRSQADLLDAQIDTLQSMASDGAVILSRHVSRGGGLEDALPGLFSALLKRRSLTEEVFFLPAQGDNVWVRLAGEPDAQQTRRRALLEAARQASTLLITPGMARWTEPYASLQPGDKRWAISVISPVVAGQNLLGFIGVSVSLVSLTRDFSKEVVIPGSYAYLIDDRGRLLSAANAARAELLGALPGSDEPVDLAQGTNRPLSLLVAKIKLGDNGVGSLHLGQTDYYFSHESLRNIPWRFCVATPQQLAGRITSELATAIDDGRSRSLAQVGAWGALALLFTGLLGGVLARQLVQPIRALVAAAGEVSAGDNTRRVAIARGDELGQLGMAFNAMADKVQHTIGALAQANQEQQHTLQLLRTNLSELEQANASIRTEMLARGAAESALHDSEARLQAILFHSPSMIFLKDLQGVYLLANRRVCEHFGRPVEEILGRSDLDLLPTSMATVLQRNDQQVIRQRKPMEFEEVFGDEQEHSVFLTSKFLLLDESGAPFALGGIATDITLRKRAEVELRQTKENLDQLVEIRTEVLKSLNSQLALEIEERKRALVQLSESEQRYATLVEHAGDGVAIIQNEKVIFANPALLKLLDIPTETDLLGHSFAEGFAPDQRETVLARYQARIRGEQSPSVYETVLQARNGELIDVEVSVGMAPYHGSQVTIAIARDIRARKLAERSLQRANEELLRLSIIDSLTNLYNRRYLLGRMQTEFSRASRYELSLSLMMIDIDHFKRVNDTYGHPAGDAVLEQIALQLQARTRQSDVAARYGGEEMVLLLPQTNASQAAALAEDLRQRIAAHAFADEAGNIIRVTVSIGLASIPPLQAGTVGELLKAADTALYEAKTAGRNRVVQARAVQ